MRKIHSTLDIDLHLFDGAAGGGAGAAAASGAEGGAAPAAQQGMSSNLPKAENNRRGSSRRRSGEFDNVVFGKQGDAPAPADNTSAPAAGEKGEGNTNQSGDNKPLASLEERRKAFEEMVNSPEYKDIYAEKFQKAFDRRFKDEKVKDQTIAAQKPIIDMMMQRYGITDGDMAKLQTAYEQDTATWAEAAEAEGVTVEQYVQNKRMERELQQYKNMLRQEQGFRQMQQQLQQWEKDAVEVKAVYDTFDLKTEMQNKSFVRMLETKWPMRDAYEFVHREEILEAQKKAAAETAAAQMRAAMQTNAARPLENGMSTQSAAIVKNDVTKLTRKERAEIARRALNGETIVF